jgi:hypothetical protein
MAFIASMQSPDDPILHDAVFGENGAFGLDHPLWMIHQRIAVNPQTNRNRVKDLSQESRK